MNAIGGPETDGRAPRHTNLASDFIADLRYAARTLGRSPGFATLAIGVLALGIGANTAVFTVVNAVLLTPLPYSGAERIVSLSTANLLTGQISPLVNIATARDWRAHSASFEAMATYTGGTVPVKLEAEAEYARTAVVDPEFFGVFAVQPIVGRMFAPDETVAGNRSVLISHAYWQDRLGGDPNVLQRRVRVGSGDDTSPIVGVLPPGFRFPGSTDLWLPETSRSPSRTRHNRLAAGRLAPGVSIDRAEAELTGIASRLAEQHPDSNRGLGVAVSRLQDTLVRDVRLTLYLLWGVVGVILLIACANGATLLLGMATTRSREVAVRAALGASRLRIVRQLITESLLLALIAGALGMLLALWGVRALVALAPADVIRFATMTVDGGVLAVTIVVSLATSVLCGLVPALQISRIELTHALKQAGTPSLTGGRVVRTRGLLVASEIALAVLLLTGAGLLVKSLVALHNVDLGFEPDRVLVMRATGVRTIQENNAFYAGVVSRISALPGVEAVGATSIPPGDLDNAGSGAYYVDRRPSERDRGNEPQALFTVVAPGTFDALGIPLRAGRDFDDTDTSTSPLVAIVNEALVRRSLGSQNAIGRAIFCHFDRPGEPMTIVGVVGDVRQRTPAMSPMPECYMPYTQHTYNNSTLNIVVRTSGEPLSMAGTIRRVAADTSPDVPVSFTTMGATIAARVEDPKFRALLLGIFAGLAVCLAMAGVYGTATYAAEQRAREIALRMALGADKGSVLRMILRQGLLLSAASVTLGLAAALAATQLLTTMLFEVQPVDVHVYLGVAVLLSAVTVVSTYIPARRAATVDPVDVLRME